MYIINCIVMRDWAKEFLRCLYFVTAALAVLPGTCHFSKMANAEQNQITGSIGSASDSGTEIPVSPDTYTLKKDFGLTTQTGFLERDIDLNDSRVILRRARFYHGQGELERALSDYSRALKLVSEIDAYFSRGNIFFLTGDRESAIADYTRVIELDKTHAVAFLNRGNAYRDKGQYQKATADYTSAIRLNPNSVKAYHYRAWIYRHIGETQLARMDSDQVDRFVAEHLENRQKNRTQFASQTTGIDAQPEFSKR